MERLHRRERVAAILKVLSDNPNKIISLGSFSEMFSAARSTLSEDITHVKHVAGTLGCGTVETISGAAGGVKYIPSIGDKDEETFTNNLCEMLKTPDRIIPGGFLYMNDIICSPEIAGKIGLILASRFYEKSPDYVITVETKGIPIAMMAAAHLNVPLIIVRRDTKVTEGSTVSINYVSGSSRRIQSMSLSKRSVKKGSKLVFVDDFMKAGGTAKGIIDLMKEFDSTIVDIGVLVEISASPKKVLEQYTSILTLYSVDEENEKIYISPTEKF